MSTNKPEEMKQPEEQPVVAEEPITEEQPKVEAAEPEKKEPPSALTSLLEMLKSAAKEAKPAKELTLSDKHLSSHYGVDNLEDTTSMKGMADAYWVVKENMLLDDKLTYEKIIEMGVRCPCSKHNSAKTIVELIQMNWIGEA
jgi:hypothetical protein